jgi:DNA primase
MKDIISIIQEHGIELKKEGNVLRAFCPFHNDTGKPNFTIYPETNSWYCFAGCGGGDAIQFISRIDNISRTEAKLRLTGVDVDIEELQQKIDGIDTQPGELSFNNQLNLIVSDLFNKYLITYNKKQSLILKLMQEFDKQLLISINYEQMQKILSNLKQRLV